MLAFNQQGLLPVGVHECDEVEFREFLVDSFPDSTTRAIIATGFGVLRADAVEGGVSGTQWLNGSYVTNKTDPNDIDLVTFMDSAHLQALEGTPAEQFIVGALAAGPRTPAHYCCDSYLVAVVPAGHPLQASFEGARDYWRKWFGHMRTILGPDGEPLPARSKGILKMGLGDPRLQPLVATWGGAAGV
jgi:hypothetical protein